MNYKVYQGDELKQTVAIDSKFFINRNLFRGYPTNNKLRVNKNNTYYYDYQFKSKGTRILLKPNTDYTVTWDYEVISGDTDNSEVISVGRGNDQYDYAITTKNVPISSKKITIKTPADVSDGPYFALRFSRTNVRATSVIDYWDIAIREGDTDYVWTPAPEDLSTAVMNGLQPNQIYEFGVQPSDGNRDGAKETISVTTRGIRFNIPKTLTVDSTITLRYEEYPLGIVPIGNEPSGYFGGGNKQNLSAKVISTENGSSVVEVAGNVIEVGERNLLQGTCTASGDVSNGRGAQIKGAFNGCDAVKTNLAWDERFINLKSALGRTNAKAGDWFTISVYVKADKQIDTGSLYLVRALGDVDADTNDGALDPISMSNKPITTQWQQYSWSLQINDISLQRHNTRFEYSNDTGDNWIYWAGWMLEPGDIATPYASFVDGDTFTAQPDGTCALFSEYKALYY